MIGSCIQILQRVGAKHDSNNLSHRSFAKIVTLVLDKYYKKPLSLADQIVLLLLLPILYYNYYNYKGDEMNCKIHYCQGIDI